MSDSVAKIEDLDQENTARLLMDFFHRILIHYGLWYAEVRDQMGMEKSLEVLKSASTRSFGIQLSRLSGLLGFELKEGQIPGPLLELPREKLVALMDAVAVNWLANDGVWFQAVEFSSGMADAKRCNDRCWAHFSPFEACSIRSFLSLPEPAGLEGLKTALNFRIYARINKQSFIDEGPNGFVFQMNDCRVQSARRRKGLDDYPCKSGGMIEYTSFAEAIDPAIRTECIGCPPDKHPEQWYCSWRFTI